MSDLIQKCKVCRGLLDEEDLFCANCGTEAPHQAGESLQHEVPTHSFQCQGCGASMSYDARVQSLRCPFCGSDGVSETKTQRVLKANRVVGFRVTQEQVTRQLRRWLGRSFWRPSDLASSAVVEKMVPVFVPYWVFSASTHTYWVADSSNVPRGARGNWVPMSGEHRGNYAGVLVGASSSLSTYETAAICPFDLAAAVPLTHDVTGQTIVEQFRVQRKYARPQARQGLEQLEAQACRAYVPGNARNLKVNVRLSELQSEPVLLPVWILAYTYKNQLYRYLVNGQTGKATGQAPWSYWKIGIAIGLAVFLALVLLVVLVGIAAS